MLNIIAAIIVIATYFTWGWWLLHRRWKFDNDLDNGFFWSIVPVAIATWYALYLAGA